MSRVFVLSPANCSGLRARWVLRKNSRSQLAARMRDGGVPLGEVFSYLSALYFRGKLAYARAFADPPPGCPGVFIITPTAGLVSHDFLIQLPRFRGFSRVPISVKNRTYRGTLRRSARKLASEIGANCDVVLLGSVATTKYLEILRPVFGSRLRVPAEFVGLGEMSRGGLLLRCVREGRQLNYRDTALFASDSKGKRSGQGIIVSCRRPSIGTAASEENTIPVKTPLPKLN